MATFLELAVVVVIVGVLFLIGIWTIRCGISPMPTVGKIKKALLQALPETIDGTIVDLGSGFGSLAFALSKKYPTNRVIGYELSPIPYLFSKLFSIKQKNLYFERKDFFTVDLKDTGLVVCYLYPGAMKSLEEKLLGELQKDACIVSHTFSFNTLAIEKVVYVPDLYKTKIYFFRLVLQNKSFSK